MESLVLCAVIIWLQSCKKSFFYFESDKPTQYKVLLRVVISNWKK